MSYARVSIVFSEYSKLLASSVIVSTHTITCQNLDSSGFDTAKSKELKISHTISRTNNLRCQYNVDLPINNVIATITYSAMFSHNFQWVGCACDEIVGILQFLDRLRLCASTVPRPVAWPLVNYSTVSLSDPRYSPTKGACRQGNSLLQNHCDVTDDRAMCSDWIAGSCTLLVPT